MPRSAEEKAKVLNAIMHGIGEGVLVWTLPDGTLSDCNQAAARILGVTREQLAGRTLDYPWLLRREDGSPLPQAERGAFRAVRSGVSQAPTLLQVGRPDGSWVWVRSSSIVLRDAADVAYAVITSFVDLSELRQAQDDLKLTAERLSQVVAGANVGTWELDLRSGAALRNPRWAEILGYAADRIEPTLEAFTQRIHPEEREACRALIEEGFRSNEPYLVECRVQHRHGHWHWVQTRGKVVERAADGAPLRVAGILVDIDARKRMEEALLSALAENERLVRELQGALENVRTLEGLLPICMYCKSIRDDAGAWASLEAYVTQRAEVAFSHGICPACYTKHWAREGQ